MTRTFARFCSRPGAGGLALSLVFSSATASADPRPSSNIPEPPDHFTGPPPEPAAEAPRELPLPYGAWQGAGFGPPRGELPASAPPPLPRPRELPRRPIELALSLASFLPSCGSGSVDDSGCVSVAPGPGLDLALLYRAAPFFAVGGEAVLSGFGARGQGPLSRTGGGARFVGVVGRVYFAEDGAWDPYLALTLGAGSLTLGEGAIKDERAATSGLGARVAGGIDYLVGTHLRFGPAASFAHWAWYGEARCAGEICRTEPALYGHLLGFATLGVRVTASFGQVF